MKLTLNTNKRDFYNKYYQTINGILNLSKKELGILTELSLLKASLSKDLDEDQQNSILFSAASRKIIYNNLKISKFNLNNYIKALKDRGIFIVDDRPMRINPRIYVDINDLNFVEVTFKFNIQ